jgi:hypothetical protein
MSIDAAEADWQRVLIGLKSLGQGSGAAERRSSAVHGRAPASRRGLPVRQGFRSDVAPELPAPARPLKT